MANFAPSTTLLKEVIVDDALDMVQSLLSHCTASDSKEESSLCRYFIHRGYITTPIML